MAVEQLGEQRSARSRDLRDQHERLAGIVDGPAA
jgi:hypothetical protein